MKNFLLKTDLQETKNLVSDVSASRILEKMRSVWNKEIKNARGKDNPKVLRYTVDSEAKYGILIDPK